MLPASTVLRPRRSVSHTATTTQSAAATQRGDPRALLPSHSVTTGLSAGTWSDSRARPPTNRPDAAGTSAVRRCRRRTQ
jgi:hypothetical protein